MKMTKALLLTSLLVLGTSCELKVGEDSDSKSKKYSKKMAIAVDSMNHNSEECPALDGIFRQTDTEESWDYDTVFRRLESHAGATTYTLDNDTFIIDGKSHVGTIDGNSFTYAGSCEANKLRLTSVSDKFFTEGTLRILPSGNLEESFRIIDNGDESTEQIIHIAL